MNADYACASVPRPYSLSTQTISCLADNQMLALQLSEMFGHSRPRGSDQVCDVLMTEGGSQERAAGFLDAEVGS